jgi:hypothetical protein
VKCKSCSEEFLSRFTENFCDRCYLMSIIPSELIFMPMDFESKVRQNNPQQVKAQRDFNKKMLERVNDGRDQKLLGERELLPIADCEKCDG